MAVKRFSCFILFYFDLAGTIRNYMLDSKVDTSGV